MGRGREGVAASRPQCVPKAGLGASFRGTPLAHLQVTEGVCSDEATHTDLFFITPEKPEREDSPSTLYKRSARSPEEIGDSPHFLAS